MQPLESYARQRAVSNADLLVQQRYSVYRAPKGCTEPFSSVTVMMDAQQLVPILQRYVATQQEGERRKVTHRALQLLLECRHCDMGDRQQPRP